MTAWQCHRCAGTGAYYTGSRWLRCTACPVTIGDERTGEEIAAAMSDEVRAKRRADV